MVALTASSASVLPDIQTTVSVLEAHSVVMNVVVATRTTVMIVKCGRRAQMPHPRTVNGSWRHLWPARFVLMDSYLQHTALRIWTRWTTTQATPAPHLVMIPASSSLRSVHMLLWSRRQSSRSLETRPSRVRSRSCRTVSLAPRTRRSLPFLVLLSFVFIPCAVILFRSLFPDQF